MPYTLKTSQISVKDPETGEYSGVDILAEQTEEGLIAELQAEGTKQVNRINQAAVDVQAAVDQAESDAAELISDTQESIDTLEAQKNTIAQTVASMAELGTDTTFTTPGMAADAGAVGDLSRQLSDVKSAITQVTRNLFDKDNSGNILNGNYVDGTGNVSSNAATAMVICPCEGNTTYTISKMLTKHFRVATYASKPTYQLHSLSAPVTNDSATALTITTEATATYIGVYVFNSNHDTSITLQAVVDSIQIEKGSSRTAYIPHITATDFEARESLNAILDDTSIHIALPSDLYAVIGSELNIYFDNLINKNASDYKINVDCTVGQQLERCYRLVPAEEGDFPFSITYERNGVTESKSSTIHVIDADTTTERTVKVLVIGDSTTNGGVAVHKLMDDATGKRIEVSFIGTRGDAPYLHEGRSGWTAYNYVNVQTDGTYTNAFYNPSTNKFDFAYYLSNNNIDDPDLVIINLGINDVFNPTNDTDLSTAISTYLACIEDMIDSIQSAVSTAKIGIAITIPPNYSQDAFGKAYGCGQTRARYKVNNNELGRSIINTFTDRTSENVYIIPININLDTKYNMETEQMPVNSRNEETYTSPTGYASVHPATSGLWQVADVYWYTLTAIFTNSY